MNAVCHSGTFSGTFGPELFTFGLFWFRSVPSRACARLKKAAYFKGFGKLSRIGCNYACPLWKLGCTSASGASTSTTIAASASVRNVTARRSTMTAISTTAVI
jgi:hypothetical protein